MGLGLRLEALLNASPSPRPSEAYLEGSAWPGFFGPGLARPRASSRARNITTANQGYSAEKLLSHPDLPAHNGPLPYLYVPSGFGFVLTRRSAARKGGKKTKTKVVGYAVGTAHSARFEREAEANWWPIMRMRYPQELAGTPLDRHFVGMLYKRLRESTAGQEELPVRDPCYCAGEVPEVGVRQASRGRCASSSSHSGVLRVLEERRLRYRI